MLLRHIASEDNYSVSLEGHGSSRFGVTPNGQRSVATAPLARLFTDLHRRGTASGLVDLEYEKRRCRRRTKSSLGVP